MLSLEGGSSSRPLLVSSGSVGFGAMQVTFHLGTAGGGRRRSSAQSRSEDTHATYEHRVGCSTASRAVWPPSRSGDVVLHVFGQTHLSTTSNCRLCAMPSASHRM